jgi:hypothetical protein
MKASEKGRAIIRDVISDTCGVKQTPSWYRKVRAVLI